MRHKQVRDVYWFIRPTLGVVICYSVAIGMSYRISHHDVEPFADGAEEMVRLAADIAELKQPNPGILPKEVVDIQVSAMADSNRKRGAIQCAIFASPENFSVTGPLSRFAQMLRAPNFLPLSSPDMIVVGDAIYQDENARVLVTVVAGEKTQAFVWVLSKQENDGSLNGCWMTDGVFPIRPRDHRDDDSI